MMRGGWQGGIPLRRFGLVHRMAPFVFGSIHPILSGPLSRAAGLRFWPGNIEAGDAGTAGRLGVLTATGGALLCL